MIPGLLRLVPLLLLLKHHQMIITVNSVQQLTMYTLERFQDNLQRLAVKQMLQVLPPLLLVTCISRMSLLTAMLIFQTRIIMSAHCAQFSKFVRLRLMILLQPLITSTVMVKILRLLRLLILQGLSSLSLEKDLRHPLWVMLKTMLMFQSSASIATPMQVILNFVPSLPSTSLMNALMTHLFICSAHGNHTVSQKLTILCMMLQLMLPMCVLGTSMLKSLPIPKSSGMVMVLPMSNNTHTVR
mmetsp:Transcript_7558/g.5455  ORF Transcript_7558/g.5455 Transcript_7558/m.5455 type:complete len:242 (-) Transcript_7558:320-1045(-)